MADSTSTPEQDEVIEGAVTRLTQRFSDVFGSETVGRVVKESLADLDDARIETFLPLLERFAADRLRALAKVEGRRTADVPAVLFLCVHNAGRSQMAMGWMKHLGGDRVEVFSGGSEPASQVNPDAVEAMAEVGIDIRAEYPKPWTDEIIRSADVVVTMGCGDACPVFPGKRYEDWDVEDPHATDLEGVREIRDDLKRRVEELMEMLGVWAAEPA